MHTKHVFNNVAPAPAPHFTMEQPLTAGPAYAITEWKTLIRPSELTKHGQLVTWLEQEHGLGHSHGHANALVAPTLREDAA